MCTYSRVTAWLLFCVETCTSASAIGYFGSYKNQVCMICILNVQCSPLLFRVHYPGTEVTQQTIQTGKQIWASEDYSTENNEVGGGCWARVSYVTPSLYVMRSREISRNSHM